MLLRRSDPPPALGVSVVQRCSSLLGKQSPRPTVRQEASDTPHAPRQCTRLGKSLFSEPKRQTPGKNVQRSAQQVPLSRQKRKVILSESPPKSATEIQRPPKFRPSEDKPAKTMARESPPLHGNYAPREGPGKNTPQKVAEDMPKSPPMSKQKPLFCPPRAEVPKSNQIFRSALKVSTEKPQEILSLDPRCPFYQPHPLSAKTETGFQSADSTAPSDHPRLIRLIFLYSQNVPLDVPVV